MTKQSVEQEIAALREAIRQHDRRYYVDAAPTISDREYDLLCAGLPTPHNFRTAGLSLSPLRLYCSAALLLSPT